MIVQVKLSTDTADRLSAKAAKEGQTLEGYLQHLADHEARSTTNGSPPIAQAEIDEERPWRGVFVLDYPQVNVFTAERQVNVNALPALPPEIIIDMRRLADDTE